MLKKPKRLHFSLFTIRLLLLNVIYIKSPLPQPKRKAATPWSKLEMDCPVWNIDSDCPGDPEQIQYLRVHQDLFLLIDLSIPFDG